MSEVCREFKRGEAPLSKNLPSPLVREGAKGEGYQININRVMLISVAISHTGSNER